MTTGSTPRATLTISQVLAALKEEFPDLSPSRIRYYHDKGLIAPQRSDSGYRKFSEADVERLRAILRMQRDRYLPLDVIAERLEAADQLIAQAPDRARPVLDDVSVLEENAEGPLWTTPMQRQELVRAAEVAPRFVTDLESFGLISADARGRFAPECVAIVKACATLIEYGLEPRHLRPFKTAVDREVDLLDQILAPIRTRKARRHTEGSSDEVQETAHVMATAALRLHFSLFRAATADLGRG